MQKVIIQQPVSVTPLQGASTNIVSNDHETTISAKSSTPHNRVVLGPTGQPIKISNSINPAETIPIGPMAYIAPKVNQGDDIYVGYTGACGNLWIRCDYQSFDGLLERYTPEQFETFYAQHQETFAKTLPNHDEESRKLIFTLWVVSQKCKILLGPPTEDSFRRVDTFKNYSTGDPSQKECVKPLSNCNGDAMCTEYALLTHHILDKLGIKSEFISGAISQEGDTVGGHAYLTISSGELVFDPVRSLKQENCWPPKIYKPAEKLTSDLLKKEASVSCTNIISGGEMIYGV